MQTHTNPYPEIDPRLNAVLIGGGNAYSGVETPENDPLLDAGLDLTGLQIPNVLIVPSARWKSEAGYNKVVNNLSNYYSSRGLPTQVLHPFLPKVPETDLPMPSGTELSEKVDAADLVFTIGGDTNRMINHVWRPFGVDKLLDKAIDRGAVMTGSSAGAVAWFDGIHTDSSSLYGSDSPNQHQFHYMPGLGYVQHAVISPHYDSAPSDRPDRTRQKSFDNMMYRRRKLGELGLGVDNNTALQVTRGGMANVLRGTGDGRRIVRALHYRKGNKSGTDLGPKNGTFKLEELVED